VARPRQKRHPFPFELEIAGKASDLGAVSRIQTLDAIQLDTGLHRGPMGFLTNDRMFEKITELEIAVLDKVTKLEFSAVLTQCPASTRKKNFLPRRSFSS
jgi:hypothetical protein